MKELNIKFNNDEVRIHFGEEEVNLDDMYNVITSLLAALIKVSDLNDEEIDSLIEDVDIGCREMLKDIAKVNAVDYMS